MSCLMLGAAHDQIRHIIQLASGHIQLDGGNPSVFKQSYAVSDDMLSVACLFLPN